MNQPIPFQPCDHSDDDFSRLVLEHQAAVRSFLGRYVRDQDVINDLAQEAFVAAYRGFADYQGRAPIRIWLFGIARNKALLHLRQEVRRRRREAQSLDVLVMEWRLTDVEEASDLSDEGGALAALETCVGKLPEHSARLVRDFYSEAKSAVELAAEIGIKESGVRMALLRIRGLLRDCVRSALSALER